MLGACRGLCSAVSAEWSDQQQAPENPVGRQWPERRTPTRKPNKGDNGSNKQQQGHARPKTDSRTNKHDSMLEREHVGMPQH